jgi:hypothetical protein
LTWWQAVVRVAATVPGVVRVVLVHDQDVVVDLAVGPKKTRHLVVAGF